MRYIGNIFSTPDKSHIIFILLIVIAIGYITSLISGFALWICIVCLYIILLTNGIIGIIYEIYSYNKIVKKKKTPSILNQKEKTDFDKFAINNSKIPKQY